MDAPSISILLALSAGAVSFISPCVLPLVPAYLSHLAGVALTGEDASRERWRVLAHALSFILGFSAIFITLGASMGALGGLLYGLRTALQKVGGVALILFGVYSMGLLRIPFLYRTLRLDFRPATGRWALLSSVGIGAVFAAAWTPCVGPILAGILMLAGASGTAGRGALLLLAYSAGLGVPFALTGLSLDRLAPSLRRLNRWGHVISVVSGAFLAVMGVLVVTGMLTRLTALLWDLLHFSPAL